MDTKRTNPGISGLGFTLQLKLTDQSGVKARPRLSQPVPYLITPLRQPGADDPGSGIRSLPLVLAVDNQHLCTELSQLIGG
ncbi:hypothetical protein D3C80_1756530 [compost metagenome]